MTRKKVLLIQGIYYLLSGLWPLLDINSFMAVTGPKTDIWLVKMVGLLTVAIAITILVHRSEQKILATLAISSALAYTIIDTWYVLKDVISPIYFADALLELIFIALVVLTGIKRDNKNAKLNA